MNLPNLLTSLRFLLIPVYIVIFAEGHMIPAFLIMVAAGITDVLDGYIARRTGQVTTAGIMLDPLADKLMLITVIVSLLVSGHISWAAAAAMFLRDLGMIAGGLYFHFRGKKTVPANWMGKLTTVLFYAAIMLIFFEAPNAHFYLWGVIAFSFVTSIMYIVMFKALNKNITETPAGHS
ncbi:CDP-alcohol phosphatidyltransferase family protein [Bacillus sp. FJAT-28004]|uniref:CDP-alcohol phosphatidyltransferase family protein n=1 Tax=Bacillus sp. FJAT-28004 TaxID=1679165 RepID=UPI0006B4E414|nr:CDP-alcohol phosphatidyltransferase family protein [Bacillus sp. FJAT-28004]